MAKPRRKKVDGFRNNRRGIMWGGYARHHFNGFRGTQLSDFEDGHDRQFLVQVGRDAASNAINENKAMNLPVTYLKDGWVVSRMPDGRIERISEIKKSVGVASERKLTKGTVLHVKKSR